MAIGRRQYGRPLSSALLSLIGSAWGRRRRKTCRQDSRRQARHSACGEFPPPQTLQRQILERTPVGMRVFVGGRQARFEAPDVSLQ